MCTEELGGQEQEEFLLWSWKEGEFELELDELEDQLEQAKAKILVCDDFNFGDAVDILEGGASEHLKHIVVIGNEGKAQGCIPVG